MKAKKRIFMSTLFSSLLICGFIVFWSFQASAIELNEAQREVWKTVEASWDFFIKGDFDALDALALERSLKWWTRLQHPFRKEFSHGNYSFWLSFYKPVSYELKPVAINIVEDVATVFYYYKWKGEKKPDMFSNRVFSTWIKQNGNWKFFGSMTSSCDMIPDCL